jgi:predicted dehydrogenase
MPGHRLSRRRFLHTTAAGAVALTTGALPAAPAKKVSAGERLRVGSIGITGQGGHDMSEVAAAGAEIVALCDVDERLAGPVRERFPRAAFYTDFRRLIEHKGLDAVTVGTPDHIHALATLAALRNGLHVFCEKPLTHTVAEARLVTETAAKNKRVTQMGTQIHAGDNYRRVVELIQAGAVGTVRAVHVWCAREWGGQDRPKGSEPIPEGFHWDTWLGPAPVRPFVHGAPPREKGVYHPFNWRGWWDFGGGTLADLACHHMDLSFWALGLRAPTRVSAEGPKPHPESTPPWLIVQYEFPARGEQPAVHLTWYHGGKRPSYFAQGKLPTWGDGTLFVGSKGMLLAGYENHVLLPEKDFADYKRPPKTIPASVGHYKEWVEACKNGGPTTCHFGYAGPLTEAVLLGNVSYRIGKPFSLDSAAFKASEPEAERYLHKEYRKPWTL